MRLVAELDINNSSDSPVLVVRKQLKVAVVRQNCGKILAIIHLAVLLRVDRLYSSDK